MVALLTLLPPHQAFGNPFDRLRTGFSPREKGMAEDPLRVPVKAVNPS